MADSLDLIPVERRDAARAALRAAFGTRPVGGLALLKGGVSGALIYRVEVDGAPHVLRLEPERVALEHRQRGFACMTAAAAVGVAPPVRYADAASGAAVMGFVESRPLSEHPGGTAGLVREVGSLIARVQATPLFPPLVEAGDTIGALLTGLDASGVFAPGLLDGHREGLERLRAACPWDASSLVSGHNDPNPRNMLFDGRRVWLVDWELAACNAPLFDIAIVTLELAASPEREDILLTSALGRPPDPALRAQLSVTRLLARLFYGCIALDAAERGAAPQTSLAALTPAAFQSAAAAGRFASPADINDAFGKMSLAAFLAGVSAPGFEATLALAGRG